MRPRRIAAVCLGLVSAPLWAGEAEVWLKRMADAAHRLNYEGTYIYLNDGRLQGMHVLHGMDEDHERERLYSLSGPRRELIRDGAEVTSISDEGGSGHGGGRLALAYLPIQPPQELARFSQHYRIELGSHERVAGLDAQILHIRPRDRERYSRHYWVAVDSGLPLRAELHDEQGRLVEQMMFSNLEVLDEPLPAQRFHSDSGLPGVTVSRRQHAAAPQPSPWQIDGLPSGFTLEMQHQRQPSEDNPRIEHRVYGDGLASISVFIEREEEGSNPWQGSARVGALNAYITHRQGHRIVVLGEVPAETVQRIGDSLQQEPES